MKGMLGLALVATTAYVVGRRQGRDEGTLAGLASAAAVFTAGFREGKR